MWNVHQQEWPMKKATVTYTAPQGEAKTLEIAGTILVSGKSDTVICDDSTMARLAKAGGMLKVEDITDYEPPKEASKGDHPKESAKTEKEETHRTHR
jgi:hypothetical protein